MENCIWKNTNLSKCKLQSGAVDLKKYIWWMIMHMRVSGFAIQAELNCLLLQATFHKYIQILHKEQCPPHRTDRRRGREQCHDLPIWSPRANSEAESRTPALHITIQGSFHFTTCKQGLLLQRYPFVPFTSRSLSLGTKVICTVQELYRNTLKDTALKLYLLYFWCISTIAITMEQKNSTNFAWSTKHLPSLYQVNSRDIQELELF